MGMVVGDQIVVVIFDMLDFANSIPSSTIGPYASFGVGIGGTTSSYLAHRFGSGHIPPSYPFVGGCFTPHLFLTLGITLLGVIVDV